MEETQLDERAAQDVSLLRICIFIFVTHQVYKYFCGKNVCDKNVKGYQSSFMAEDCETNNSGIIDDLRHSPSGTFRYDSLQDRTQVRLFCLYPRKYHDGITGRLCTVSIEQLRHTRYGAISYVWGNPQDTVKIRVKSDTDSRVGTLSITKSLEAALKRIRRRKVKSIIWADGICINQTDVLERGHQVRLMRSIYAQANLVHVWLGPRSHEFTNMTAQRAFQLLQNLKVKSKIEEIYQGIAGIDDEVCEILSRILDRPWFRRIWILQEIGVARAAIFYYGGACIDRTALYRACYIIGTYNMDHPAIATLKAPIIWIRNLETHFHFNGSKSLPMMSKFDLFDLARPCAATDPRDMIYALMGHPIFDTDNGEDFLPIDYSHSREFVYTELELKLLREPRNPLQLLSLVKHNASRGLCRDRLPSWVPAWDVKSPMKALGNSTRTFTASKSLQQTFIASVDGLCIQGYSVDTIEWQSATSFSAEVHPWNSAEDINSMDYNTMLMDYETRCSTSLETRREALARDCPDQFMGVGPKGSYRSTALERLWSCYYEARKWCTGRRFFITAKGRFGLGPPVSQVGDPIYILSGAAVPFVFRRGLSNASSDSQDVQLCGECYVDGIMSGEGDRMLAEGETYLENLRII